eukprot:1196006-Prorocentrum_minimum.AAC.1
MNRRHLAMWCAEAWDRQLTGAWQYRKEGAYTGQPMCTRGAADCAHAEHTRGSRWAHAGQPMCTCGAADLRTRSIRGGAPRYARWAYARAAGVRTRGIRGVAGRCAHLGWDNRQPPLGLIGD